MWVPTFLPLTNIMEIRSTAPKLRSMCFPFQALGIENTLRYHKQESQLRAIPDNSDSGGNGTLIFSVLSGKLGG